MQVGMMLNGTRIENMVIGGPAYNCHELKKGDDIIAIDGKPVNKDNVLQCMIGSDQPGSFVTLKVEKASGGTEEITLCRMCSETIADRRRMFEWFTKMKMRAEIDGDSEMANSKLRESKCGGGEVMS